MGHFNFIVVSPNSLVCSLRRLFDKLRTGRGARFALKVPVVEEKTGPWEIGTGYLFIKGINRRLHAFVIRDVL